jgi:DNA-binding helix-hairpin-helix protein with protein kinase domain
MPAQRAADFEGEAVEVAADREIIGPKIGSGAEGSVYRIEGSPEQALKIFNHQIRETKAPKVRAMIDGNPGLETILWPERPVKTTGDGEFLGYSMAYKSEKTSKGALQYAMTDLAWDSSQRHERHAIASRLAEMVEAIHEEGHAIGDFNHDNILIDDDGEVFLIDCDGYHITDKNRSYADVTYYPRYSPPEGRGGDDIDSVRKADRFCLGVHVFQLLMEGFHPYQAQGPNAVGGNYEDFINSNKFPYVYPGYEPVEQAPGADAYTREIPEYLQTRFKQCFTEAGKNIIGHQIIRPEPSEWILPYTDPEPSPPSSPPEPPDPPAESPADTPSDAPTAQSPWQDWSSVDDSDSDSESDEDESIDIWEGWDG